MAQKKKKKFTFILLALAVIMGMLYISGIVGYALGSILLLIGTIIIVTVLGSDQKRDREDIKPNNE